MTLQIIYQYPDPSKVRGGCRRAAYRCVGELTRRVLANWHVRS